MTKKNATLAELRLIVKPMTRSAYDLQDQRLRMGGRLAAHFKTRMGQAPGVKEADMEIDDQAKMLSAVAKIMEEHKSLTEGLAKTPTYRNFKPVKDGVITDFAELCMVEEYLALLKAEKTNFKHLEDLLDRLDIVQNFFKKHRGCGPRVTGIILSEVDPEKMKYPSSLWKYAGLDVGPDGLGRSRRKEHLVDRDYDAADGSRSTRKSITYNARLKTKLMGVLAPGFLKAVRWDECSDDEYDKLPDYMKKIVDTKGKDADGRKTKVQVKKKRVFLNEWAAIYYRKREQLKHHAKYGEQNDGHPDADRGGKYKMTSPGRRNFMAMRYMIKMFLIEVYTAMRTDAGLPVSDPYHIAKLKMDHGKGQPPNPDNDLRDDFEGYDPENPGPTPDDDDDLGDDDFDAAVA